MRRPDESPSSTNCRSLIQEYFEFRYGIFMPRDAVEMPGLWNRTGEFVDLQDGLPAQVATLPHETILICEQVADAYGTPVDRSPRTFPDPESYRMRLHTAILLREIDDCLGSVHQPDIEVRIGEPLILHASALAGGTALWPMAQLLSHYRVVAAKQLR
ncbi:hypothetical protein AZH51_07535 [Branchiibius sp. NY16-3462-2]|nr:hypothetical protein AZH51_07535 [Branchiibius sp. NY16-3462-2]